MENMKTKDFIKMLQDEDPSGEGYLRFPGGFPYCVEAKEGYWDGPYSYFDKNNNYVTSSEGYKIDVRCMDVEGFVETHFDKHDQNNWENIKKKFKFNFEDYCYESQRKEKEDRILKHAKESYDEMCEIHERIYLSALDEMKENAEKGWTWFQNREVEENQIPNMHVYYTWKIYDEKGKEQGSNLHMTESVQHSGEWEKLDNGVKKGYYQWKLKNK